MIFSPKVSVVTITYNHEDYITQALDGILMQEYLGEIEFIIANDTSSDSTDEVIKHYLTHKYIPSNFKIKYTKHTENKGMVNNFLWALNEVEGKYIALCEGDDYWTDSLKLQKQVDILENNSHISICMTCVKYFFDGTNNLLDFYTIVDKKITSIYNLKEYLRFRFSHTSSFVFRKSAYDANQLQGFFCGDQALVINTALKGDIYYLSDLTSLYRINKDNITNKTKKSFWINSTIDFYKSVNKITNYKYSKLVGFHILYYKILSRVPIVFLERVLTKIYFISLKFFK